MATPDYQIQFLVNLQRLLSEGSFVSTYKYALLMALADVAIERGQDDDQPLTIPTEWIAEKFIEYYWRQSAPFVERDGDANLGILRQNTGKQAGIIRVLHESRARYEGSLTKVRLRAAEWRRLLTQVDGFVRIMPLWKLQTVGRQQLDFLYANAGTGRTITLKPGVVYCLRKHYPMVADLVKGAWARYVRRFNLEQLGEQVDLGEFLFGSERADLSIVAPVLRDFQRGECFYCQRPLTGEQLHVDHFIPWSRYPVDLGHNFVLAHASCNGKKSDRLAAANHLERWVSHQAASGVELGAELKRRGVTNDMQSTLRIVNWAYRQTFDCRGLTWLRADELQELPLDWDAGLAQLLN